NRQLRMGMFAALDQRIATRFTIKPMDLAESAAYLRHHLALAGREEPLFADDAIARLHRVASGLPRALTNAAVAALIAAAATRKPASTLCWPKPSPPSPPCSANPAAEAAAQSDRHPAGRPRPHGGQPRQRAARSQPRLPAPAATDNPGHHQDLPDRERRT